MKIATIITASMCLILDIVGGILYSRANKNDNAEGKSKAFMWIYAAYLFLFISIGLVVIRIASYLLSLF